MPRLSKTSLTVLALILAIALAFLSIYIERTGPELAAYGNLCGPSGADPCYKPVLKAGFPLAYLFDAPGVSRERQLAFGEDKLVLGAFILDMAFYFSFAVLVLRGLSCGRA